MNINESLGKVFGLVFIKSLPSASIKKNEARILQELKDTLIYY